MSSKVGINNYIEICKKEIKEMFILETDLNLANIDRDQLTTIHYSNGYIY